MTGSASLIQLARQSRLKAVFVLWKPEDGSEALHLAAGISLRPNESSAIYEELRVQLPAPIPRLFRVRHSDLATPLSGAAREAGIDGLLAMGLSGNARILVAASLDGESFSPKRIREIENLLRTDPPSALHGWIEAECRREEAEFMRRRSERRLHAFTEAAQMLARETNPESLPSTLLEAARRIVPVEASRSERAADFSSLLSSPDLHPEDVALLHKLSNFYELRVQNFRFQNLVEIAARMESVHALASGLAHDFNNSMGILLGYTAFLREKLASQPDLQPELDGIEKAAGKAIDLTAKLSSFSKRRGLAKRKLLRLDQLVAEFLPTLRRSLGNHITPQIEVGDSLPPVESAPEQIQEILSHLALNSRDAMPEGGQFFLRLKGLRSEKMPLSHTTAQNPGKAGWVMIEAEDTGRGISQHLLSRIFEPFFSTKEGEEGSGLGCAMIYSIARAHGGWVEVESPPGQGAQFRIFLPAAE